MKCSTILSLFLFSLSLLFLQVAQAQNNKDIAALKNVEKLARQGNAEAQLTLGLIYLDGKDIKQDMPKGKEWL